MNKERFAQAVLAQKEKFYRIAYAYVKNEQDALDIVSEATYKGLKSLHTLKSPEYFDTWMTRIIINTAADYLRKASRAVNLEEDALDILHGSRFQTGRFLGFVSCHGFSSGKGSCLYYASLF